MKRKLAYILLLVCLVSTQFSYSQRFQRINTSNGLSNNTVISILQDRYGFLWFGTDDGLNKYDGYSFKVYKPDFQSKNAISHSIAKVLFEDSKGNIWIGTDGGGLNLYKPETETFEVFYFDSKDKKSLSHNNVSAIVEDKNHNIWVGTYGGGLNKFDSVTRTFTRFKNEVNDPNTICSNYINCLLVDSKNILWIGTWGRGLNSYDESRDKFVNYFNIAGNHNSLSNSTVNCLFEDKQKRLWIGTWGGGLDLYHSENENFEHFVMQNGNSKSLSNNVVRSICSDNSGMLWIGTFGGGINRFNPKNKEFTAYQNVSNDLGSISNNNIWTIYHTTDDKIWAGTIDGGVNRLDLISEKFQQVNAISPADPLKNYVITSLFETKSSEILVGSGNDGFYILDKTLSSSRNIKSISGNPNSLINNTINSIIEDKYGEYWIGTQDGISRYNPVTRQFKNYKQTPNSYKCLSFNVVNQIYEDHFGTIWIATWGGGLNRYDRQTDQFDYYLDFKKVKVTFLVDMTGIKVSRDGVHIAGSMNGWNPSIDELKPVKDNIYAITMELYPVGVEYKFLNGKNWGTEEKIPNECALNSNRAVFPGNQNIVLDAVLFGKGCNNVASKPLAVDLESDDNILSSNHVYCIYEDREGTLLVGTNNGLNQYNRKTDRFIKYQNKRGDTTSLTDNHVSCIYEDITGTLWIGTLGGGINRLNKSNLTFSGFNEKNGLANNNIRSISEDNQGNLWISTNVGISRFNQKSHTFRNYDKADGLQENSFHTGAVLKTKKGEFLFGGSNGLIHFNPAQLQDNNIPPKVFITDLYISNKRVQVGEMPDGRTILEKSLQNTDLLKLSYKDNIISFQFTAIHYSAPEKNQFAYKLEGFDEQWHYIDSKNRLATYTNLNGGSYTLLVKASNSDGVWTENPTRLNIYITPPFWKRGWFAFLIMLLTVAIVYSWYKKKVLNKHKALIQDQIIKEKKIIELEKHKLELEVENKNAELGAITMQMQNKSKIITEQINRLQLIKQTADEQTQQKLARLVTKLNSELDLNKDWEYFELHFDKVYQNFISKLKTKYPELPASDIRLAAYIRMGLSSKEISELMNNSLRGVESRRYRLRKEFGLNQGENLSDFIFKL